MDQPFITSPCTIEMKTQHSNEDLTLTSSSLTLTSSFGPDGTSMMDGTTGKFDGFDDLDHSPWINSLNYIFIYM